VLGSTIQQYAIRYVYRYAHQISRPCSGSRAHRNQAGTFRNRFETAMNTLAGKTAISSNIKPQAEIERVAGNSNPKPSIISTMPLTITIAEWAGMYGGISARYGFGLMKWFAPAAMYRKAWRYRLRVLIDRKKIGAHCAGCIQTHTPGNVNILPPRNKRCDLLIKLTDSKCIQQPKQQSTWRRNWVYSP